MENITLIASIPAVMAAVELLKTQGLTAKRAPLVAVLVALLFSMLAFLGLNVGNYTIEGLISAIVHGLLAGFGASGFYDGAKLAGGAGGGATARDTDSY